MPQQRKRAEISSHQVNILIRMSMITAVTCKLHPIRQIRVCPSVCDLHKYFAVYQVTRASSMPASAVPVVWTVGQLVQLWPCWLRQTTMRASHSRCSIIWKTTRKVCCWKRGASPNSAESHNQIFFMHMPSYSHAVLAISLSCVDVNALYWISPAQVLFTTSVHWVER